MDKGAASETSSGSAEGEAVSEVSAQGRPIDLEDWLNGTIYHPLSMRLARALAPTPISPNMVSIAGGLMIVMTAYVYGTSVSWPGILLGLLIHMSWHVLDGADGDLARLTNRTSSTGEVIDGLCDIGGHIVLYVTLGTMLAQEVGAMTAWVFAIGAGFGRIIQAAHYEVQRRQYQHWVYGKSWLRVSVNDDGRPSGIFGLGARLYILIGELFAPGGRKIDALMEAEIEAGDDERQLALRNVIRKETVPVLKSTYLLSANYRTIALGLSLLAGSPLYFFAFEAIFLTLILFVSIFVAKRASNRIVDQAKSLR